MIVAFIACRQDADRHARERALPPLTSIARGNTVARSWFCALPLHGTVNEMTIGKSTAQALRKIGMRLEGAEEGIACAGTALESVTVKARGKAFLFVRAIDARLKLGDSIGEAKKLAAKDPAHYSAGSNGWVQIKFGDGHAPLPNVMERWIAESHALAAGGASSAKTPASKPKKKAK
jgi:hypothetical protein